MLLYVLKNLYLGECYISLVLIFVSVMLIRLVESYTVFVNARRRNLDVPVFWASITLVTGFLSFLLYFVINYGLGEKSKPIKQRVVALSASAVIAVFLVVVSIPVGIIEDFYHSYEYSDTVIEKQGLLKYVTYDKMGNEYNAIPIVLDDDNELIPCYTSDGERLDIYDFYKIDKNGYAIKNCDNFEERKYDALQGVYYVYFDEDHNIYYDRYNCSWDKDGNLIFKDETYLRITYENTVSVDEYYE